MRYQNLLKLIYTILLVPLFALSFFLIVSLGVYACEKDSECPQPGNTNCGASSQCLITPGNSSGFCQTTVQNNCSGCTAWTAWGPCDSAGYQARTCTAGGAGNAEMQIRACGSGGGGGEYNFHYGPNCPAGTSKNTNVVLDDRCTKWGQPVSYNSWWGYWDRYTIGNSEQSFGECREICEEVCIQRPTKLDCGEVCYISGFNRVKRFRCDPVAPPVAVTSTVQTSGETYGCSATAGYIIGKKEKDSSSDN